MTGNLFWQKLLRLLRRLLGNGELLEHFKIGSYAENGDYRMLKCLVKVSVLVFVFLSCNAYVNGGGSWHRAVLNCFC
ncbi:hypothetical protein LguiA_008016 [Lonicera macranthoides]